MKMRERIADFFGHTISIKGNSDSARELDRSRSADEVDASLGRNIKWMNADIAQSLHDMPDEELVEQLLRPTNDLTWQIYLNSAALSRIITRLNTPATPPSWRKD